MLQDDMINTVELYKRLSASYPDIGISIDDEGHFTLNIEVFEKHIRNPTRLTKSIDDIIKTWILSVKSSAERTLKITGNYIQDNIYPTLPA